MQHTLPPPSPHICMEDFGVHYLEIVKDMFSSYGVTFFALAVSMFINTMLQSNRIPVDFDS